ncbi:hypothetical protein [Novosphingobium sp.]|uniref:hypothetical protein n=1 Tax=Novosphingobium sp. TaxID=1874826 RepID=UPI002732BDE5|nr:hypothetical protein [Novosphingobium sp.]MDP3908374.1 hypothetical protein [Novosphingobium sp.]
MTEPKAFASLSPRLLARKGAARPAMRPQLGPLIHDTAFSQDSAARQLDDLGWNDMGHDVPPAVEAAPRDVPVQADIVAIVPEAPIPAPAVPEVVRQQREAVRRVAKPRRSALADGRRAAFTLRVDAERHLKLRLACTVRNRSAQQLVTDALDRLLDELPDISALAAQLVKQQRS